MTHRHVLAPFVAALALLLAGCDAESTAPISTDRVDAADEGIVLDHVVPESRAIRDLYASARREAIGNGLVHYSFETRIGSGEFDVVRIHRVVRERRAGRPIATRGAVFMLTGAALTFDLIYLRPGTNDANRQTSVAAYLASHGIDVWGMDFGWTRVPADRSDFSFMRDWGMAREVDHVLGAMSIARVVRRLTGQGGGPLPLLGFSYGGSVAYGAAGLETQQRRRLRDISALAIVDMALKYAPANDALRQASCEAVDFYRSLLAANQFQDGSFGNLAGLAQLARLDPSGDSPVFEGFSNLEAILFVGTNTYLIGDFPAPFWHFVASDGSGGLAYTDEPRWVNLVAGLPPYMPVQSHLEIAVAECNEENVAFDDHLGRIRLPILYIGAGGGTGTVGYFTTTLTSSRDVRRINVSLEPPSDAALDFGHGDMFIANNAPRLVWRHLLRWLAQHEDDDDDSDSDSE